MSNYIETRVAGIPCTVRVFDFVQVKGSHLADNPDDYNGYVEYDFEICDRRERPAPWLARKATDQDLVRIHETINALIH